MDKVFNILIVPSLNNSYDLRMANDFAVAFRNIGHKAIAIQAGTSEKNIEKKCILSGCNVVLKINGVRRKHDAELKNVRFIGWYQDIFPGTNQEIINGLDRNDILYTMGDRKIMGLEDNIECRNDILMTGVNKNLLLINNEYKYKYDYSLCGFIPSNNKKNFRNALIKSIKLLLKYLIEHKIIFIKNAQFLKKVNNIENKIIDELIEQVVIDNYLPLEGSLDINQMSRLILKSLAEIGFDINNDAFEERRKYYSQTYPRRIDRESLILEILEFTESIALFGPNWNTYKKFKRYHKGIIDEHKKLINIYTKSKINLTNNTHGIGLHSRTLEAMSVGSFIATHRSKHDELEGGILESFEPDIHFCYYKKNSIKDDLSKWIDDNSKRIKAGKLAREVIKKNHLWEHRAIKVINDLNK